MKKQIATSIFLIIEISVVIFILSTTSSLPEYVASNFNGAGEPNSYMTRPNYSVFILVFAVGIPCLVLGAIAISLRFGRHSINVPHKEYWLSPENKQKTIEFLSVHITHLSSLIALFIGYVHWLVIQANGVQPAKLSNVHLLVGMGLMLLGIIVWVAFILVRFNRVPKS